MPHSSNTKRKLNVYQTFGKHPGHLLNVSCSILRAVFRGCITPNSYLFEFNNRDSGETKQKRHQNDVIDFLLKNVIDVLKEFRKTSFTY